MIELEFLVLYGDSSVKCKAFCMGGGDNNMASSRNMLI
jgi:hypothetical protein